MTSPGGFAVGGYPPQDPLPAPYSPGGGQAITAGAVTYTTSTGPDGRVVYHPFRAVPASYQTPNGVVTGIQWVPAEATQVLPTGAQPANADFAASWNRGHLNRDDEKALKQWQRDEEKRRRKEEKSSSKRMAQMERDRREDQELRAARERDVYSSTAIARRKSFNAAAPGAGPGPGPGYPSPGSGAGGYGGGYTSSKGYERKREADGKSDLTSRFGDMGIDGGRGEAYERERKISSNYVPPAGPGTAGLGRPRKYSVNEMDRRRSTYGAPASSYPSAPGGAYSDAGSHSSSGYPTASAYPTAPGAYPSSPNMRASPNIRASPNMRPTSPAFAGGPSGYPPSTYPGTAGSAGQPYSRPPSPYGRPGGANYARAPSPYAGAGGATGTYPRGHILEGQPMNRSRAPSPVGGGPGGPGGPGGAAYPSGGPGFPQPTVGFPTPGGASPNIGAMTLAGSGNYQAAPQEQLAAPPGFSRPINAAQPYTPFEAMKIQDMDDFLDNIPRMPLVMQTHDCYHEDWIRLMQDLALAWAGRLPIPEFARTGRIPKRSTLAADLVDLWNSSFFLARGVEIVLYKGRERRSGPNAGTIDRQLANYDPEDSSSDDSSSDSSETDDSDVPGYGGDSYGLYGRQPTMQGADTVEARRRRLEAKREKKRRHKEKKMRKKAKARENKYALYLTCVPAREGGSGSMPGSMGPPVGGQGMAPGGFAV